MPPPLMAHSYNIVFVLWISTYSRYILMVAALPTRYPSTPNAVAKLWSRK